MPDMACNLSRCYGKTQGLAVHPDIKIHVIVLCLYVDDDKFQSAEICIRMHLIHDPC